MDGNSMIPWPPLPLEPGIYGGGVARVGELVSSYSFGTNKSLDSGFFSYGSSLMLPNIQEPRTNDHFCCYFLYNLAGQVQDCSRCGLGLTVPPHGVRAVRPARGHQARQHLAGRFPQRQARGLRLGEARRPRS